MTSSPCSTYLIAGYEVLVGLGLGLFELELSIQESLDGVGEIFLWGVLEDDFSNVDAGLHLRVRRIGQRLRDAP